MSEEELLNTLVRYDSKREIKETHKELLESGQRKIAKI